MKNCKVAHNQSILFESNDGLYNVAIGERIVSAFNGPADLNSFDLVTHELSSSTIKPKKDSRRLKLEQFYQQIREFREGKNTTISRHKVFEEIKEKYPSDWLLPVELYELAKTNGDNEFANEILAHLETVKEDNPKVGHLIDDGVALVAKNLVA